MKIEMTQKDIRSVAKMVMMQAISMGKKGSHWRQQGKLLSPFEVAKIANKMLKPLGEKYDLSKF